MSSTLSDLGQTPACLVPKWSDFGSQEWPTYVQYGWILIQYGRIWSQKSIKNCKKLICSEMSQKGLEMVPIASGGPGNRFLYYNNVSFHIIKKNVSYYLLPLFPC